MILRRRELRLLLTTACCVVYAQPPPSLQFTNEPSVKIALTPFPAAPPQSRVMWTLQQQELYCVGSDARITDLRWNCRNCNASNHVNSLLNAATTDLSQQAGQPVIKLSGLTNARRDINDKLLFCEGRYQASTAQGIETKIVSAEALIQVAYMNKPYIIDATTRKLPVRDRSSGNRFLVPCNRDPINNQCVNTGEGKQLLCIVDANPASPYIEWTGAGGQVLHQGASYTVSPEAGSIQCRARPSDTNREIDFKVSDAVSIVPYDRPIVQNKFMQMKSQPPLVGGKVTVGQQLTLTCIAYAYPKPTVFWRVRMPANHRPVANATCNNGLGRVTASAEPNIPNVNQRPQFAVQSECTLNIDHYDKAGDYWCEDFDSKLKEHYICRCAACVEVGEGQWDCGDGPQLNDPGQRPQNYNPGEAYDPFITIDVIGPPEFSKWIVPRVDPDSTGHGALVTINYCADPPPSNSGVEWLVDNTQIRPGVGRQGNFEAQPIKANSASNFTDCYMAQLSIIPVQDGDLRRDYRLRVTNANGATEEPFNLAVLMEGGKLGSGGLASGWIALIVIASLLFVLIVLGVFCCFLRGMYCFAPRTKKPDPSKYLSNVAPNQLASEPQSGNAGRYTNGYASEKDAFGQHETVNYAEMDLVNGQNGSYAGSLSRVPVLPSQPPRYSAINTQVSAPRVSSGVAV